MLKVVSLSLIHGVELATVAKVAHRFVFVVAGGGRVRPVLLADARVDDHRGRVSLVLQRDIPDDVLGVDDFLLHSRHFVDDGFLQRGVGALRDHERVLVDPVVLELGSDIRASNVLPESGFYVSSIAVWLLSAVAQLASAGASGWPRSAVRSSAARLA
jgi:hypothetical protein